MLEFLKVEFPEIFRRGVAELRSKAKAGNAAAAARLSDLEATSGATHITLEGDDGGAFYYHVRGGEISVVDERPNDVPVHAAFAAAADAAEEGLELLRDSGWLEREDSLEFATSVVSKEALDTIADAPLQCHVIIRDAPGFDNVVIRVGLGVDTPPDEPIFTASLTYDTLEALWDGSLSPIQFVMGGRLQLAGDASRAMQLITTAISRR